VPTLRPRRIPPIAPTASIAPTLRFRHLQRTTVPTLRPRIIAPPASTTSTAASHRIRTACMAFVANTLARTRIPACAISWREIPHREESRFGTTLAKNVGLDCAWLGRAALTLAARRCGGRSSQCSFCWSVHVRSGRISYRPKLGRLQISQNKPTISEVHLQDYPDWWRGFHDPDLNQLTQIAFDQNLTLLSAGTRVLQASAALEIAVGISYPQVQQGRLCGNHVTRSPMNVLPCHEYQGASLSAPLTSCFSKSASWPSSDKSSGRECSQSWREVCSRRFTTWPASDLTASSRRTSKLPGERFLGARQQRQ
jgi:hypothetical protein